MVDMELHMYVLISLGQSVLRTNPGQLQNYQLFS